MAYFVKSTRSIGLTQSVLHFNFKSGALSFFQAAKAAGVRAVIIKITEGSNPGSAYVNPKARQQITNARAVGLRVHAYHYAKFNGRQDAWAEADWFTSQAKQFGIDAASVMVLDIEDASNAHFATNDANAFLRRVKAAGYPHVDVYSMASWFWQGRLIISQLIAKNLWVANYGVSAPGVADAGLWQFTSQYSVGGQQVDMSYDFNGFYTQVQTDNQPSVPASSWVDSTGLRWSKENGAFVVGSIAINLRQAAHTGAAPITTLLPAALVKYDAKTVNEGYIWVRQPRSDGQYGYLAVGRADSAGRNIDPFGTFR